MDPIVERRLPAEGLRDVVETIWVQEEDSPASRTPSCVVPTGTIEILFHYGDRFSHVENGQANLVPRCYVTGQRTVPVFTLAPERVGIVIASLYPWGLVGLFPECTETPDGYVDLELLVGRDPVAEVVEQLQAATDLDHRIRLVESFLLQHRGDFLQRDRIIDSCRWLANGAAGYPVAVAAERAGMSRRHYGRLFRSTIGTSPKTFSRIMRFQRATSLRRGSRLSWAAIAAECGFVDQAHLAKEIKHFSARTAGEIDLQYDEADNFFNGNAVSKFFNTVYL